MKRTIYISGFLLAGILTLAGCGGGGGGGTAVKDSITTGTDGKTNGSTQITTTNAAATIAPGTTLTDVSGAPVTGKITPTLTYSDDKTKLSTKAVAAVGTQNLNLLSFVDIVLTGDASTVKYVDPPMEVNMKVPGAKAGDTFTNYSFNGTSWVPEETVTADKDGMVVLHVSHFSYQSVAQQAADKTAPIVKSVAPTNGAVALNTTVAAAFNEPMSQSSIKASGAFTVTAGGKAVDGTVSYDLNTYTTVFKPKKDLDANTEYIAKISKDVTDFAGNKLGTDKTWTFTTGATKDTTAPTVKSTIPANNSTGVAVTAKLLITFSEPMDPASIKENLINLIPGTISYDPATNTATFTPDRDLEYGKDYIFTIRDASARDLAGNKLTQSTVKFTTTPQGTTGTTGGTGGTGTGGI